MHMSAHRVQVDMQLRVTIRPGHAICNATDRHLQLCYVGPLADPAAATLSEAGAAIPPNAGFLRSEVMLDLVPGQVGSP